jgi:hypothetical protein
MTPIDPDYRMIFIHRLHDDFHPQITGGFLSTDYTDYTDYKDYNEEGKHQEQNSCDRCATNIDDFHDVLGHPT